MDLERPVSRLGGILLSVAAVASAAATAPLGAALADAPSRAVAQVLAPERIRDFLPSSLGHLARGDIAAERVTALGTEISEAEAQYRDNNGHYVTLRIEDMGGARGLESLVPWASVKQGTQSSSGDEKTYTSKGHRVHERWTPPSGAKTIGYGQYAVLVGERYLVEASGEVTGIDVLRKAVGRVDIAKLESLASEEQARELKRG